MNWIAKPYFLSFLLVGFSGNIFSVELRLHHPARLCYDRLPITPKTWEEVDLVYQSMINGKRYTNSIQLLRPIQWLLRRHMTMVGRHVIFSASEFGINYVHATVVALRRNTLDTRGINWANDNNAPVIGRFKRYVTNMRTYGYTDDHGDNGRTHVTANHLFYVRNKLDFMPIEEITEKDQLVGSHHRVMHLICHRGHDDHCGKPDDRHVTVAYNLEIYKRHMQRQA